MIYAQKSVTGKRIRNEDCAFVPKDGDNGLVIVADGMGGHNAGQIASQMAVEVVCEAFAIEQARSIKFSIKRALEKANFAIYNHAQANAGCRGMGTTIVLAYVHDNTFIAANIGDSRLYHYKSADKSLEQISIDHSFVATLVESGHITAEQAKIHPQRNIITRALGTSIYEQADFFSGTLMAGDAIMLCSDGLYSSLSTVEVVFLLSSKLTVMQKCDELVSLALKNGSSDNVTVALCQYMGDMP